MNYVIIGNSAAAVGAIEAIRRLDTEGSVTVVSNEAHHTYSRPLISYLLSGKTDRRRMLYRPGDFYEKNRCRTCLGRTAAEIRPEKKQILLDDGTALSYDKLLYAAGSVPFIPKMEGIETVEKKFTFLSLDDALALEKALTPDARVLILGAGLIGLKCAEGICGRSGSITVVDLSPRILSSILDGDASEIVEKHLTNQGISFKLGQSIEKLTPGMAETSKGEQIPFDILVLAAGVRPNTRLLTEAGASADRGILTDCHMQSSLPDIYAAGDCCESTDVSSGESRVLALLPNAYRQGECAGTCMAGGDMRFGGAIPMNAIGFFGLHILTAGTYTGNIYEYRSGSQYKKLFYENNRLKGYLLIGNVEKAGIYTALIRRQTPLDTLDFELVCETPGLMAFSRKFRARELGGIKA